jgi:F0F1-type ATP synthase assembly protein I
MTTDIKRLIRKKQRLYNKSKKSKKPSHKKAFKGMRILLEINYTRTIGVVFSYFLFWNMFVNAGFNGLFKMVPIFFYCVHVCS